MVKVINTTAIVLVGFVLFSCMTTKWTSTIYSDNYNKQTDSTSVIISPYGVVKIYGKWVKTRESEISGQHFFVGKDSVVIAIALHLWNTYEFSHNNPEVTRENFVRKFYEWDAPYLQKQTNGQVRIIKENKEKDYIVWSLSDKQTPQKQELFLFGLKGNVGYSFYITTNKWSEDTKVKFLEQMYNK